MTLQRILILSVSAIDESSGVTTKNHPVGNRERHHLHAGGAFVDRILDILYTCKHFMEGDRELNFAKYQHSWRFHRNSDIIERQKTICIYVAIGYYQSHRVVQRE